MRIFAGGGEGGGGPFPPRHELESHSTEEGVGQVDACKVVDFLSSFKFSGIYALHQPHTALAVEGGVSGHNMDASIARVGVELFPHYAS